jgi:hypothetical protein
MSYMTKLPGVPDTDDVKPGMAFFAGTGPTDKTCESCAYRGYWRTGKHKFNTQTKMLEEAGRHSNSCAMFLKLTHRHGPAVNRRWAACKYFQDKTKSTPKAKPTTEDAMPKVSDVFKSTVMRASGLNGSTPIAHILGWRSAVLYGNEAHVLDVEIAGAPCTLKLTSMLSHDIAAVLGDDELDHWPGHAVKLYSFEQKIRDKDTDEDKLVDMIRAMAAPKDAPARTLALRAPSTTNDDPDSVPF